MLFKRRRSESRWVLSGFGGASDYDARRPTWESADDHADLESAVASAQVWQQSAGPESTVEVIRIDGSSGRVVAVVDRHGISAIGAP
jgi:hypothetical protein